VLRGGQAGLDRLAERLPERVQDVSAADVDLLITRGSLGFWAGRLTAAIGDLRWALRLARQDTALLLPVAHLRLSQLLFDAGDWDEALVHAHLVLSLEPDREASWAETEAQRHRLRARRTGPVGRGRGASGDSPSHRRRNTVPKRDQGDGQGSPSGKRASPR